MEETIIENGNSINTEPVVTPSEPEVDIAKLQETNKKLFERAKTAEAKLKEVSTKPKEEDPDLVSRLSKIEQIEAKRQFQFENQLSPKETDYLFNLTKGNLNKDILKDEFVQGGLEKMRQLERFNSNIPGSTNKGFLHTGKEFKDLTEAERKSAFEEDMRKRRG